MAMTASHAMQIAQRAHAKDVRHRAKVRGFENALIRKAAVSVSAGAYGALRRNGVTDTVGGFPWKLGMWLGSTLVEALSSSAVLTNFAAGVSDATMAIYMDRAIANKTWVAGEGEAVGDGGEI